MKVTERDALRALWMEPVDARTQTERLCTLEPTAYRLAFLRMVRRQLGNELRLHSYFSNRIFEGRKENCHWSITLRL